MPVVKTASVTPSNVCGSNQPTYQWVYNGTLQSSTSTLSATQPGPYTLTVNCPSSNAICAETVQVRVECNFEVTLPVSSTEYLNSIRYTNDQGSSVTISGTSNGFSFPYNMGSWSRINDFIAAFNAFNGANTISASWSGPITNRQITFAFKSSFRYTRFSTYSANYSVNGPFCDSDELDAVINGGLNFCNYNTTFDTLTVSPTPLSTGYTISYNRNITSSSGCSVPASGLVTYDNPFEKKLWVGFHYSFTDTAINPSGNLDYLKSIVLSSTQPFQRYQGLPGDLVTNQTIQLWSGEGANPLPNFTTDANGVQNIPGGTASLRWSGSANGNAYAAALQAQLKNAIRVVFGGFNEDIVRVIFATRNDTSITGGNRPSYIFVEFASKHLNTNQEQWFGFRRPPSSFFANSNRLEGAALGTFTSSTITSSYFHVNQDTLSASFFSGVCNNSGLLRTSEPVFRVNPSTNNTSFSVSNYFPFVTSPLPIIPSSCNSGQLSLQVSSPTACTSGFLVTWFRDTLTNAVSTSQSFITASPGTYYARVICPTLGIFTLVQKTI